jgi:hypothetical protein
MSEKKNKNKQNFSSLLRFPSIYIGVIIAVTVITLAAYFHFSGKKRQSSTDNSPYEARIAALEKQANNLGNTKKPSLEERVRTLESKFDEKAVSLDKEIQPKIEKASVEAVDKLKSDLFTSLVIPVISIIVSIFAAFAVKDVVAAYLQRDERDKLEQSLDRLEQSLDTKIVCHIEKKLPQAVENAPVYQRFQSLEIFVTWLEYDMALKNIAEVLSGFDSSVADASKMHEDVRKMLEHLERTYDLMFIHLNGSIDRSAVNLLKKAQYNMLQFSLSSNHQLDSNLRLQIDRALTGKIRMIDSTTKSHLPIFAYERSEGIYDMQKFLLFDKLDKMKKLNPSISREIDGFKLEFQKSDEEIRDKRIERNNVLEGVRSDLEQISVEYSDDP